MSAERRGDGAQPSEGATLLPNLGPTILRDRVVEALERRILDETFGAEGRLPTEAELTKSFGVSRTVVRDALRVLETRGLIEIKRGSGTWVRSKTIDAYMMAAATLLLRSKLTVGDLLDARAALESHLAVLAMKNRQRDDLDRISSALTEFASAVNKRAPDEAARWHVVFHTELIRATRLPALEILLGPLQQMMLATSLVPRGIERDDPRGWRVDTHRAIYNAVRSQSREALEAALAEHWRYTQSTGFEEIRRARVGTLHASPVQLVKNTGMNLWE